MSGKKDSSETTTRKDVQSSEEKEDAEVSKKVLSEQSLSDRERLTKSRRRENRDDRSIVETFGSMEVVDGVLPDRRDLSNKEKERVPDAGAPAPREPDQQTEQQQSQNPQANENPDTSDPNKAVANLTSRDVSQLSQRNFSRIDTDNNGLVSSTEVDMAVKNRDFTGQDAQFVAMLKVRREKLSGLFGGDDVNVVESGCISKYDMEKFEKIQAEVDIEITRLNTNYQFFELNKGTLDTSGDGVVDVDELKQASLNNAWSDNEKVSLVELAALSEQKGAGLTLELLKKNSEEFITTDNAQMILEVNSSLNSSAERLGKVNSNLFGTEDPLESIRSDAFKQGAVGNCYFISALSSLAGTNPQAIKEMITDNGNGTYTVTFPGAKDEPITVESPTEAELSLYAEVGKYGIWPAVMEKAYGKYCNQGVFRRSPLSPFEKIIDQEGGDGGSIRNDGLRILTGKDVDSDIVSLTSDDELEAKLKQAIKDGVPIDAGIIGELGAHPFLPESWHLSDNKTDDLGLQCQHEYSVIGYDEEKKLVKVRNPWGSDEPLDENGKPLDGVDDGIFEVTLTQFRNNFSTISYGQR